jgi:hypothetical protein
MAISIDRVYQKVLALANKEQRGYITPQEFNLFADHVQMEIFEQYFYDLNQFMRTPGNNTGHSDAVTNLEEKISFHEIYDELVRVNNSTGNLATNELDRLYRIEMIRVNYDSEPGISVAEEIQLNELQKYGTSPLGDWSKKRPVYTRYKGGTNPQEIRVYPNPDPPIFNAMLQTFLYTDEVLVSYIQKPATPNWAYIVVNDKPLYNSTHATDFDLHDSEEAELVHRILALTGIAIEKPLLTQTAAGAQAFQIQQEKQ